MIGILQQTAISSGNSNLPSNEWAKPAWVYSESWLSLSAYPLQWDWFFSYLNYPLKAIK